MPKKNLVLIFRYTAENILLGLRLVTAYEFGLQARRVDRLLSYSLVPLIQCQVNVL